MSASIVCPSCGAVNGPTNAYCVNCGKPLAAAGMGAPAGPPAYYPPPVAPGYPPYPGAYPYYPMPPPRGANFSNILSGLFGVWTKNFVAFFLVYLVLGLITGGIGAALSYAFFRTFATGGLTPIPGTTTISSSNLVLLALYALIAIVLSVIITTIVLGGMTEFAVRRFRGESMTIEQALRRGMAKFLSIFGANILYTLIIFGIFLLPILLLIPLVLAGGVGSGGTLAAACGLLVAFVVGGAIALYVGVALILYAPAIMMENATATGGLSRSWRITKGRWWSLFGSIVITVILAAVITVAIATPAEFTGNPAVALVASALASAIVSPWIVILAAVAYDLIVRPSTPSVGPSPPYAPGPSFGQPPGGAPPSPPGLFPPPSP